MENTMVCEEVGKIFGPESGLPVNPTPEEIRASVNEWIEEFRANVLLDVETLIAQTTGTPREAFWREMREKYAAELEELSKDIAELN